MTTIGRVALIFALAFAAPALAEKRVALVIGNSPYKHAPALANPKNDAEGMAAALQRLKFDVALGVVWHSRERVAFPEFERVR